MFIESPASPKALAYKLDVKKQGNKDMILTALIIIPLNGLLLYHKMEYLVVAA